MTTSNLTNLKREEATTRAHIRDLKITARASAKKLVAAMQEGDEAGREIAKAQYAADADALSERISEYQLLHIPGVTAAIKEIRTFAKQAHINDVVAQMDAEHSAMQRNILEVFTPLASTPAAKVQAKTALRKQ